MSSPDWLIPLTLPLPGMMEAVTVYLFRGKSSNALLDTGLSSEESLAALESGLRSVGLCLGDIDTVFCTHFHADHCGLGRYLQQQGAMVVMGDRETLSLSTYFARAGYDRDRIRLRGAYSEDSPDMETLLRVFAGLRAVHREFVPDRQVRDQETLLLGGREMDVVLTPGHTAGHCCLRDRVTGILFTGDHLLGDMNVNLALPGEGLGADVLGAYLDSLDRIIEQKPCCGYPGHGKVIADIPGRISEIRRFYKVRLGRIQETLSQEPRDCADIAQRALGVRVRPLSQWLSVAQVQACLENLVACETARRLSVHGRTLFCRS